MYENCKLEAEDGKKKVHFSVILQILRRETTSTDYFVRLNA